MALKLMVFALIALAIFTAGEIAGENIAIRYNPTYQVGAKVIEARKQQLATIHQLQREFEQAGICDLEHAECSWKQ